MESLSWFFPNPKRVRSQRGVGAPFAAVTLSHDMRQYVRGKQTMKTLITLFAGVMLIGCASGDNQSTRSALGSAAAVSPETQLDPSPWRQSTDPFPWEQPAIL